MKNLQRRLTRSPARITATYAVFGVLWILITDQLVFTFVDDPVRATQMQTAKGWVFVTLSAAVIYGLIRTGQRDLEATNSRLDTALRQTTILHRILRHNLRNACNIIQGNAEIAAEDATEESERHIETIKKQNQELIRLSKKSKQLHDIVLGEPLSTVEIDLADTIEAGITEIKTVLPDAEITAELPEELRVEVDPRIDIAIYELLANAIEHNDATKPIVSIESTGSQDSVTVEISDNGPGTPEMERAVIEEGFEEPMFHSQGLGLWLARTIIVARSGGTFDILDTENGGTTVRLTVPTTVGE